MKYRSVLSLVTLFCLVLSLFGIPTSSLAGTNSPQCSPPFDKSGFTKIFDSQEIKDNPTNNGMYEAYDNSYGIDGFQFVVNKGNDGKIHAHLKDYDKKNFENVDMYLVFKEESCWVHWDTKNENNITDLGAFEVYVRGKDAVAPTLKIHGVENITNNTVDVRVSSTETGKVHYLVKEQNETPPTIEDLRNSLSVSVKASKATTIHVEELDSQTSYRIYAIAVDITGNTSVVESYNFKTLGSSDASLNFSIYPTEESGSYTLDPETGVAVADIRTDIMPQGAFNGEQRVKPMDVIFVMDVSGSMGRGFLGDLLGWIFGRDSKLEQAKKAAKNTINNFKEKAIEDDRFALITFNDEVKDVVRFNDSSTDVQSQLTTINNKIQRVRANDGTNYHAALTKADELFGNSQNTKYVIFLTDGRPESGPESVTRDIDGMYAKCHLCRKHYIKEDNVTVINNWVDTRTEFNYNGDEFIYSRYETYHLSAIDAAKSLGENNVKLYTVGLGRWINSDKQFLRELSSITGSSSYIAETASQLNTQLNHITDEILQQSITSIQVKINLNNVTTPVNGNFGLVEDSNATISDDGNYLIVNIPDVKYEAGKGTPEMISKQFAMEFNNDGDYIFNDISLVYTDLSGTERTVRTSPLAITVIDTESYGLKFKNNVYYLDVNQPTAILNLLNEVVLDPEPDPESEAKLPPLTWGSVNMDIATVAAGNVTPKKVGETQIKVTAKNDDEILEATTKVIIRVKGIQFNNISYPIEDVKGKDMISELKSISSGLPISSDAIKKENNQQVWTSSNESIVTIENGIITERESGGYAIITTRLDDTYMIPSANEKDKEAQTVIRVGTKLNDKGENSSTRPGNEW